MVIDPWDNKEIIFPLEQNQTQNNNKAIILVHGKNIIKGPFSAENKRYELEFNYYYDTIQMCGCLNTINKTNNYNNISLKLYKDIAIIENISRSDIYRGSEYMLLALQIIYKLKYKKSMLQDLAYFSCDRKMNFFSNNPTSKKMEIQNKLIYLLKFGSTFYMPFGYKPVIKKNEINDFNNEIIEKNNGDYVDISNNIDILIEKLNNISWNDINNYIINIKLLMNNDKLKNSNKIFDFRIYNYKKWKTYWLNICKSWNIFYNKYNSVVNSPFQAFSTFNKSECDIFINWLELYSFSVEQTQSYNSSIFNDNINNNLKILAGINDFKKLKLLVEKCNWLNKNIRLQPLISIYSNKI
jgi:hypothetical protein